MGRHVKETAPEYCPMDCGFNTKIKTVMNVHVKTCPNRKK